MEKYELIPEQLVYEGTVSDDNFFHPAQVSRAGLELTHSIEFLDKLESQSLTSKEIRAIGFPMSRALIERGKHISQGTLDCARFAMQYGVSMNIAGGTHHSFRDHGEGFCIYNDIAIAANILLYQNVVKQVLIVDLDVHQGNGTASIFRGDERVFTFSMHGERNYPTRKEQSDLDLALPDRTKDEAYLSELKDVLPKLLDQVEPDIIFYLSGVDVLEQDKLGRLSLTMAGCKERDHYVLSLARQHNLPIAISMGGGYSPKISDIVNAHANTFRLAQELYF